MSSDEERFEFLVGQKPICTQSPIKSSLGVEKHRELRAKSKLELGLDLLEDRCPNVFNCKSLNKGCIGRPFPLNSEIYEALKRINVSITTGIYKDHEVYLAEAVVECSKCPFREGCETSCASQDSYLRRSTRSDSNPPDNTLVSYDDLEKGMYNPLPSGDIEHCEFGDWSLESLPLDCLSPRQSQVIEMTVYKGLEQSVVAAGLGVSVPTVSRHKSRAVRRLTEFGRARRVIAENGETDTRVIDYYMNNLTQQKISKKYSIDQGNLSKDIKKWYSDNCT